MHEKQNDLEEKWEIFWRTHFIVFAVDSQRSVKKACKYMSHSVSYELDLFSDRTTFIKMSMSRDPDNAKHSADLSF